MRHIKRYVDEIDEELEGAKNYAERYVECKVKGDMAKANRYKEMAHDELKHSTYIHEWAVDAITALSSVYIAPVDMQKKWEESHARYVEKVAWIKQMLAM